MGVKANAVKMCTIVFGWCEEVETSAESFTLFQTRLNTSCSVHRIQLTRYFQGSHRCLQAMFKVCIGIYRLFSRSQQTKETIGCQYKLPPGAYSIKFGIYNKSIILRIRKALWNRLGPLANFYKTPSSPIVSKLLTFSYICKVHKHIQISLYLHKQIVHWAPPPST